MRLQMSYHRFNNLGELLNGYLATKIGQGILSFDLMDKEYNYSLPSKVNGKCVYEGQLWKKCLLHQVKCSAFDAIYIGNNQQKFKKRMDGNFSNLLYLLKSGQKPDSFTAHYGHHFKNTTSNTDLCKCMLFKVVKQLNPNVAMIFFTKYNCNLYME